MCYKICNFDVEAQTYVEAWKASTTKNELFELLDQSDVWSARRARLGNRFTMGWYRYETTLSGRKRKVYVTNIEGDASYYSTWKMAKYMHKALQRKGVRLPAWSSRDYHCNINSTLPLKDRLNDALAS